MMPTDLFAIYEFNRRLAEHFRGTVDFWEFWNEQDLRGVSAWDYAADMKAVFSPSQDGPARTSLCRPGDSS